MGGRVNYMNGQCGKPGEHITVIFGPIGPVAVHKDAAPYFLGFLKGLAEAGAPLDNVIGFNYRTIAGSKHLSQHAYGNAIDINQLGRDRVGHGLKQWCRKNKEELEGLEKQWRMVGGQHWHSPDLGHWEWGGPLDEDEEG